MHVCFGVFDVASVLREALSELQYESWIAVDVRPKSKDILEDLKCSGHGRA